MRNALKQQNSRGPQSSKDITILQSSPIIRGRYIISNLPNPLTDDARSVGYSASILFFLKRGGVISLKKILREVRIILPIGVVGSMLLIICTYVFKCICYILEKLSSFFEEDGFLLVIVGIVTIAYAIKWVSSNDSQED